MKLLSAGRLCCVYSVCASLLTHPDPRQRRTDDRAAHVGAGEAVTMSCWPTAGQDGRPIRDPACRGTLPLPVAERSEDIMIPARSFPISLAITLVVAVGILPGGVSTALAQPAQKSPSAQAQSKQQDPIERARTAVESLIARLRGRDMPEGIVKSNGRIEATQVDVAAKYPGRLATLTVNEGDEVTAGQAVATI